MVVSLKSPLYFIALLPPPHISEQITIWKNEMASKYGARHALKSPPHITLQMPFRRPNDEESIMIQKLESFASQQSGMDIWLSGFGCFSPRVLYVDIANPEPIIQKFNDLRKFLKEEMNFSKKDLSGKFHPHITLATRDLKKEDFPAAWSGFKSREYETEFQSRGITLLKHNGKLWEVFQTFQWGV